MANRIVGDLENKLIIYGYRKPLGSRTYLPFLPEAIVDEFIDAKVVLERDSKEQKIYQIYCFVAILNGLKSELYKKSQYCSVIR